MNFIVSTDAAADLDLDYIRQNDVKVVSMKYYLKEQGSAQEIEYTFGNGEDGLTIAQFYQKLRSGAQAKTALINIEQHKEHFCTLLNQGKDIIHIPLSSGLSGTAEFASKAAEELNSQYPQNRIIVIDFKGASMGQGLFVDYLVKLRNQGKTTDEAANWAQENILRLCHYFTVDDLGFLRRGGRVSGAAAFIGTLIKIKPLLHVSNEGKLVPVGKTIGRKKALFSLVNKIKLLAQGEGQTIFISHGDCFAEAEWVAEAIKAELKVGDIKIGFIGPIIGAHSGPGTVAVFFMGTHR